MANLARFCSPLWDLDTFHIFNDFQTDQADTVWVDTVTDSGTVEITDAANGIVTLTPSDGSVGDNDETYFANANEVFLVAAGRSLNFRARVQFTEGNTDDVNIAAGFASAVAANLLVDDGAGMRASGNLFAIYKVDGGTVWRCTSRNGSAVTDTISTTTAGGASYQVLEINIFDADGGTNVTATFKVDGVYLMDSNNQVIRHTVAIASSTEMQAFLGIKNGAATTAEALLADYVYAAQTR